MRPVVEDVIAPVCEVCGDHRFGFIPVERDLPGGNWQGPPTEREATLELVFQHRFVPRMTVRAIVLCEDHFERATDGICDALGVSSGRASWSS